MTNKELAQTFKTLYKDYKVHYVKGGCLQKATPENKATALKRFDNGTIRRARIEDADENSFFGDCVCSIKSVAFWNFNFKDGGHAENKNDFTTEQMISRCKNVSSDFSHCKVGELLWKQGHCGIVAEVLPDGRIISAEVNEKYGLEGLMLTACNCSIDGYNTQDWAKHGMIPEITYESEGKTLKQMVTERLLCKKGDKGEYVREIQTALAKRGYDIGSTGADGDFGNMTEKAVRQFQTDANKIGFVLAVDGIIGYDTIKLLLIGE